MSNFIQQQRLTRRTVLRGVGACVALPWLEVMSPQRLTASSNVLLNNSTVSSGQKPLRMAFFYVPNGMHMPDWKQTGERLKSTPILKPLEKYLDRINVFSGLSLRGAEALGDGPGDHARSVAAFLTGAHPKKTDGKAIRNGVSIDQVLAQKLGDRSKLPSLELGTEPSAPAGRCDSGYSCVYTSNVSWRTETSPVAKEINPQAVFDRLFGTSDASTSRDAEIRNAQRRRSILDLVADDTRRLQRQLGSVDQQKLDEYLYSLHEIEKRVKNSETLVQIEIDVPDYPRPDGVPRQYEDHVTLLLDMMALAFQADVTRISTFMFANAGSNRSYRNIDVADGHHDLSHHGNNEDKQGQISKINQFHMSLFSRFIERLATTQELDGSVLDHSLILYGSGIADGNRHNHNDLPIMTIGSGDGRFETGKHFDLPNHTPLTNLYLTMMQASGLAEPSFSDSNGIIQGLTIEQ